MKYNSNSRVPHHVHYYFILMLKRILLIHNEKLLQAKTARNYDRIRRIAITTQSGLRLDCFRFLKGFRQRQRSISHSIHVGNG